MAKVDRQLEQNLLLVSPTRPTDNQQHVSMYEELQAVDNRNESRQLERTLISHVELLVCLFTGIGSFTAVSSGLGLFNGCDGNGGGPDGTGSTVDGSTTSLMVASCGPIETILKSKSANAGHSKDKDDSDVLNGTFIFDSMVSSMTISSATA
jgi:hypothetical protein